MTTRVKFTAVTNAGSGVVLRGQGTSLRGGGGTHMKELGMVIIQPLEETNLILVGLKPIKIASEEEKREGNRGDSLLRSPLRLEKSPLP